MEFKTTGICAKSINFDVKDGIVKEVAFEKGCNGNLKGLSSLIVGMKVDDVITKLKGTTCGQKMTSCPDQLAKALEQHKTNAL